MKKPLEIHFQNCVRSPRVEEHIRGLMEKLEHRNHNLTSCLVLVDKPHQHRSSHAGWKATITVGLPQRREVVASRSSDSGEELHDNLFLVLKQAFESIDRQLRKLSQHDRGAIKHHPAQAVSAVIKSLFSDHGFLRSSDGRDIYFHANSVLHTSFDTLKVGLQVSFSETEGEKGPQASTVHILTTQAVPELVHR